MFACPASSTQHAKYISNVLSPQLTGTALGFLSALEEEKDREVKQVSYRSEKKGGYSWEQAHSRERLEVGKNSEADASLGLLSPLGGNTANSLHISALPHTDLCFQISYGDRWIMGLPKPGLPKPFSGHS